MTLPEILKAIEKERRKLNGVVSDQLNSERTRQELRAIGEKYFEARHSIAILDAAIEPMLQASDSAMRELISLSHRRGRVARYKQLLKSAKDNLAKIDGHLISSKPGVDSDRRTDVDTRIIATLGQIVPSAASSYEQALSDLEREARLSWRGPATDLREALRETLDYLAPDRDVSASTWYKQEKDTHGPTMRQKVRYVLGSRGASRSSSAPAEDATMAIDEAMGRFVRSVYTRSSISTHTPTDKNEVLRLLSLVRVVLGELLEVQ